MVETISVIVVGDVRLSRDQYPVLAELLRVKLCICAKNRNHTPLYPIMHDDTTRFTLVSDDSCEIIMIRVFFFWRK